MLVCRVVTKVIDAIIRLFRRKTVTEQICNLIDNFPLPARYSAYPSVGIVQEGSSGSPLFNSNGKVIGHYSGSGGLGKLFSPCAKQEEIWYGKFQNAYADRTVRDWLNPLGNFWVNNFNGLQGRDIVCYERPLNLRGRFFPARDYQLENRITIQSRQNINIFNNPAPNATIFLERSEFVIRAAQGIVIGTTPINTAQQPIGTPAAFQGVVFRQGSNVQLIPQTDCGGGGGRSEDTDEDIKIEPRGTQYEQLKSFLLSATQNSPEIFEVFPNPSEGVFKLRSSFPIRALRVYDATGKEVFSQQGNIEDLHLEHLPMGLYFLRAETQGGVLFKKIQKGF